VLTESTTGNVFGYISDVEDDWSCTAYYRYDGLAWTRWDLEGVFDWGAIIHSTSVPCNWVVGETTYLKANDTTDCADSDAEYAMPVALVANSNQLLLQGVYHPDWTPDETGDWMFIHSDCTSYYEGAGLSGERVRYQVPFGSSEVTNRPGDNCDPTVVDISGTAQTLVVDGTAPVLDFDWPDEGTGPTLVTSAFAGVKFDATDNVALFSGADDWDLQRQIATWNGSSCGTFANDTTAGHLTSGTTSALDQVAGQGLADETCYRWTLAARDANGNTAATITSGSIRTSLTGNLGRGDQHTFETWDLGGGDSLAVNVGTGNLVIDHPIVELPIRGSSVSLGATYNSHDPSDVGMGPGWRLDAFRRLTVNGDGSVTFTDGDGSRHTFTAPTGSPTVTYSRPPTLYATLTRDTAATPDRFTLTYRDQSTDVFDELTSGTGFLVREQDRHANGVDLGYTGSELSTITDTAPDPDRVIDLTWTSGRLTEIEDWAYIDGAGVVQTSATGARRRAQHQRDVCRAGPAPDLPHLQRRRPRVGHRQEPDRREDRERRPDRRHPADHLDHRLLQQSRRDRREGRVADRGHDRHEVQPSGCRPDQGPARGHARRGHRLHARVDVGRARPCRVGQAPARTIDLDRADDDVRHDLSDRTGDRHLQRDRGRRDAGSHGVDHLRRLVDGPRRQGRRAVDGDRRSLDRVRLQRQQRRDADHRQPRKRQRDDHAQLLPRDDVQYVRYRPQAPPADRGLRRRHQGWRQRRRRGRHYRVPVRRVRPEDARDPLHI
jgi:hypothetical protein